MRTSVLKNFMITGVVAMGVAGIVRANEKRKSAYVDLSSSDIALMNRLAQTNLAEIASAEIAVDKSKNNHIVKFARSMISDHSKALDQLTSFAKIKNVRLPATANENHQSDLEKLNTLNDDQFDKEYVLQATLNNHQEALAFLSEVKDNAEDKEFKALIEKLTPTIDHHLRMDESMTSLTSH